MPRPQLPALALAGAMLAGFEPAAAQSNAGDGGFVGRETRELVKISAVQGDAYRRGMQDGCRGPR